MNDDEWFKDWISKRYPAKWDKPIDLKEMYNVIQKHLKKGEWVLFNNFLTDEVFFEEKNGYYTITFSGLTLDYTLTDDPKAKKITRKYERENAGIIFDNYVDEIKYSVKNKENPFERPFTDGFTIVTKLIDYSGAKMNSYCRISFFKQTRELAPQKRCKKDKAEHKFCYGIDDDLP